MGERSSSSRESVSDADSELLNSLNLNHQTVPPESDVVVVGGGIHSLIYAIHVKKKEAYDSTGQ